ncbi:hypothetical protein KSS87_013504 [Heliosperma pusillum]|nr:hypothetical protein KSS87_013504 [Heliosperma pusillum]
MKSFFPTNNDTSHDNNNNNNNNDNNNFQNYPDELISRGTHQNHQDLCLSLHSLNDPGGGASAHHAHPGHDQTLFQGGFDGGWAHQQDVGRFTRLMGWVGDSGGSGVGGEGRGGILFNTNPPPFMSTQTLLMNQQGSTMPTFSHNNNNNQRGTLQSSYSSLTRVFEDNPAHNIHHDQSMSGIGHGSDSLMGFYIPSQIHVDLHATGASMSNNRASSSSLSTDSTQQ